MYGLRKSYGPCTLIAVQSVKYKDLKEFILAS